MSDTVRAVLVDTLHAESATVELYELCVGLNVADLRGFEVRTSTGYRAVFPEAHTECDREVCLKPDNHDSYVKIRRHCHGVHHAEQAREFARQIAATYGSATQGKTDPSVGRAYPFAGGWTGHKVPNMSTSAWKETAWAQTMERPLSVEQIEDVTDTQLSLI